ncbi:DNA-binding response regulator [Micromonospora sp. WMMD1274]|uniref:helix-turn-helix transcriptional regulator n=1 Tax=Micromonospora sp. WMMD1274 TaxID=3404116 RepID=UPI003B924694
MVWIAVADPLPLFRAGVAATLTAEGHQVVAPSDLASWVRARDGCIVVITLAAGPDWLLLSDIAGIGSDAFIVALLPEQDGVLGSQAVRAGAHSVLGRDAPPAGLQRIIQAAAAGLAQLPVNVVRELRVTPALTASPQRPTARQLSWLRALAAGGTVARLAELEGYSERAMYRMLQRLYAQIGVKTRTEALIRAQTLGWLVADGRE